MSEYVSTEISVNVGELPNSPGFKASVRVGLGPENSGNIKNTFREKSGHELNDLTVYFVISAKSEESARHLLTVVQHSIDRFNSDEELPTRRLNSLKVLFAKNDNDEFEGEPKFVFTPSVHNHYVVVQIRPIEGFREQLQAQLEMVTGLAGDVFERKQEVYLEFDLGRTFGDLVHSEHAAVDLFESVAFKLWVHLHPELFSDLTNLASNLGAPEQVGAALGAAKLFSSASLNLNFRSATELSPELKGHFETVNQRFKENVLHKNIPEETKKFYKNFAEHGTGNVHLFAGYPNIAVFVDLHLPGVSQFLSE